MKINQVYFACLLFFMIITFSSCFQVIEDIHLLENGSGNYKLVLNLSQSKTKIATLINVGSVNGHHIPSESEINTEFKQIVQLLKTENGISNVNGNLDFNNYIGTLTLNFNSINRLNTVMQTISSKYKIKLSIPSQYSYSNNILTKKYLYTEKLKNAYSNIGKDKEVFNGAVYTSIFHFDNAILKSTNNSSKIAPNKKAVMQQNNIANLLVGKETFTNSITLTK